MFTDIKNCGPSEQQINLQILQSSKKPEKSKGKLHKLLRPLIKILNTKSNKKDNTVQHPNNVNLNNFQTEQTAAALEDYADVIRKVANDEEFLQSYYEQDPFCDEPYGNFNDNYNPNLYQENTKDNYNKCYYHDMQEEFVVPVNYIRTDAGTFFWTTAQTRVDDDLVEPTFCDNFNQTIETQWHNNN